MATSGSVDYTLTQSEVIYEALQLIGVYDPEETISSADFDTASRSLNMMLKTWSADGVKLWKRATATLTLVADQKSYTIGTGGDLVINKPLHIIEAYRTESDIDTPLDAISWQEYIELSSKATSSIPTQFHYQPGNTTGTLYIWPVADATAAANITINLTYYSYLEDMDAISNNFDFPTEWLETIAYNLAVRIAPKFQRPLSAIPEVAQMAQVLYQQLRSWDEEDTSIFFGVDFDQS